MMDESEIPGSLRSSNSPNHDSLHQSESMLNFVVAYPIVTVF